MDAAEPGDRDGWMDGWMAGWEGWREMRRREMARDEGDENERTDAGCFVLYAM